MDDDISDEQQDWSVLESLGDQSIPKRGEKDFEPDGTGFQNDALQSSREAMYSALSARRSKFSKTYSTATWIQQKRQAVIISAKGVHFTSMGKTDRQGATWLDAEEALYLCERGSLVCYHENGIQLSLQALYACAIRNSEDLDNYHVYSYLKKLGFVVLKGLKAIENSIMNRSSNWLDIFEPTVHSCSKFLFRSLFVPGIYRSYSQLFDDLRRDAPNGKETHQMTHEPCYFPHFNVWKPGSQFKKSNPRNPDYKICVLSARDHNMPSWKDIQSLLTFNDASNTAETPQLQKLSKGYRDSIIAVVDAGIVSFYRIAQTDFSKFPVYNMKSRKSRRK